MICTLPHIIWVLISGKMRWVGDVVRMGERRGTQKVLVGKAEIDHLEVLGRERRTIQKWILRK